MIELFRFRIDSQDHLLIRYDIVHICRMKERNMKYYAQKIRKMFIRWQVVQILELDKKSFYLDDKPCYVSCGSTNVKLSIYALFTFEIIDFNTNAHFFIYLNKIKSTTISDHIL